MLFDIKTSIEMLFRGYLQWRIQAGAQGARAPPLAKVVFLLE